MKRIEKILKKQANAVLPDDNFKQSVRSRVFGDERVFDEVREPVLSPAAEGASRAHTSANSRSAGTRRVATVLLVVFAAIVIGLSFYFVFATTAVTASEFTYVSLDINPSFALSVAADNTVAEVSALNADAAIVLYGMNLVGMPVEDAARAIVAESETLGFIDKTETRTLNLLAVNDSAAREAEVSSSIVGGLLSMFSANGWNTGVYCGNPLSSSATDGTRYTYRVKDYCSPGKSVLVAEVSEVTGKSLAALSSYTADQLNKILKQYDESVILNVENALSAKYEDSSVKADADKLAAERQSFDSFVDSLRDVLDALDDMDEDEFGLPELHVLLETIRNDYIDLTSTVLSLYHEIVDSFISGDWFGEFFEGLEDLFDDIIELYEEDMHNFAESVAREMSEWKAEIMEELRG